jgi:hypothetical protein
MKEEKKLNKNCIQIFLLGLILGLIGTFTPATSSQFSQGALRLRARYYSTIQIYSVHNRKLHPRNFDNVTFLQPPYRFKELALLFSVEVKILYHILY